jgi:GNAT superfamily N-acetyltransferase
MGSQAPTNLPPASSPSVILTTPTPKEKQHIWSLSHSSWGGALEKSDYLRREAYLTTIPLAKNGGITHWILTDASLPPDERPILSSCESIRKSALIASASGESGNGVKGDDKDVNGQVEIRTVEGTAHGIASVFTDPKYRGQGYASRMMQDLGPRLRGWNGDSEGVKKDALFSVLYSDVGKSFYAKNGWQPMLSTHFSFPPLVSSVSLDGDESCVGAKPIGYHELAELCAVDERNLRIELATKAKITENKDKQFVALKPDLDAILWHLMREDYMTKHIFERTPLLRGAVWGDVPGHRAWAVWTRGYYGGLKSIEGNHLHILRFVVEDEEGTSEEELGRAFRSIMRLAQQEAAAWHVQDVQIWNPTGAVRQALDRSGVECVFVERETDSIASLMWYGTGDESGVEWVANEKYGWC